MPITGRPSKYSVRIASEICGMISTSTDSIEKILASDERFPSKSNFYMWIQKKPAFQDMYARAKKLQLMVIADELMSISDTPVAGLTIIDKPNGKTERRRGDMTRHRELQIETRKWILSKLMRKEYGDRDQQAGGADRLNEIVEAMKAGPVPRGQINRDEDAPPELPRETADDKKD